VEGPDELVATAAYQPEPAAAAAARRFVRDTLESWVATGSGDDGNGLVDDAVLLTSELVTNAVVHAGTPVHVTCKLAAGGVEVAVRDSQPASLVPEPPENEHVPAERTSGRGLLLPAALASAWGVTYGQTAKAVWFRIGLGVPGVVASDQLEAAAEGPGAFTAAIRQAAARERVAVAAASPDGAGQRRLPPGVLGYPELLRRTAEAARLAVSADAACILLADEDGELRVCSVAGALPAGQAQSVVTVPFMVDGRITGLLSASSAATGMFGDGTASGLLAELADRSGPALERARLADLDRLRRDRMGSLAIARDLLGCDQAQDKVMAIAGDAVVPRLAEWCAIMLAGPAGLQTAYARHAEESRSLAVAWLLDRACEAAAAAGQHPPRGGSAGRAAWRWPLFAAAAAAAAGGAGAGAAGGGGTPSGTADLATDTAWCFPFASPGGVSGVLVVGCGRGRLPRDVAALAVDLADRIGLALGSGQWARSGLSPAG
jgi:anti-sigma regulatory factor (Ser/Thr protein kinase)